MVPDGVYENVTLLHDDVLCAAVMIAAGFTVTVTVKVALLQVPGGEVAVTLYVAVTAAAVVLLRTSASKLAPAPDEPPVRPVPLVGAAQA